MKFYLIGFMGSGKTTAGKKMAALLNSSFTDLDNLVEREAVTTISELFNEGEEKFREAERRALHGTAEIASGVISTGGGTPCFYDNMDWMNAHGITVYLRLDPESLCHRLLSSKRPRPLISGKSPEQLKQYITETLKEREKFYRQARYMVRGEDLDVRSLLNNIRDGESQLR